jgi:hypothetical protein
MTALTIQDVSRRSGLSEPTLRCYERDRRDGDAENEANLQVQDPLPRLEAMVLR